MHMNKDINKLLISLSKSKFRGSFHLNDNMKKYVFDKGLEKIKEDGLFFINTRLKDKNPKNDGKQTPTKRNSHPIFIAQHATGCGCRGCLERIHNIPKGIELDHNQINYIIDVLMTWIEKEIK